MQGPRTRPPFARRPRRGNRDRPASARAALMAGPRCPAEIPFQKRLLTARRERARASRPQRADRRPVTSSRGGRGGAPCAFAAAAEQRGTPAPWYRR